eukprot:TRINITY_DN45027_c0_g1_i1.p1 TRINITY_DN45027_c0_g1~~TRINITY_DN45027_c0_g1_i1.p1  ORF type:complete len:218 (+),score=26.92 TRINITY_DN45027_c0_g1_i1:166-819(+)
MWPTGLQHLDNAADDAHWVVSRTCKQLCDIALEISSVVPWTVAQAATILKTAMSEVRTRDTDDQPQKVLMAAAVRLADVLQQRALRKAWKAPGCCRIQKYGFRDQGFQNGVALWIEASQLWPDKECLVRTFTDVQTTFYRHALILKATASDGSKWVLATLTYDALLMECCECKLSDTSREIIIIMHKVNPFKIWSGLSKLSVPSEGSVTELVSSCIA